MSGPIVKRAHELIGPLRDLFAALFFLFFGLQIDPATLPPVLLHAAALGVVTALTKLLTGLWSARRAGLTKSAGLRAGGALVARGEFSIVIAGLGVTAGLEPNSARWRLRMSCSSRSSRRSSHGSSGRHLKSQVRRENRNLGVIQWLHRGISR